MANPTWDETTPVTPTWDNTTPTDDIHHETPEVGGGEALARGAENGALFGFGPAVNGALETALGTRSPGLGILDQYRHNRDSSKEAFNAASAQHPWLYGTGNVAGAIIPGVLSGGSSLAEEGLAGAAKAGAKYGALAGLGSSNADLTKGEIGQAAKDTALSGAVGAIGAPIIQKALTPLVDPLSQLLGHIGQTTKGAANTAMGMKTPEQFLSARAMGQNGINLIGKANEDRAAGALQNALGKSTYATENAPGYEGPVQNLLTPAQRGANLLGAQQNQLLAQAPILSSDEFGPFLDQLENATTAAKKATGGGSPGMAKIDGLVQRYFYDMVPDEEGNEVPQLKPQISMTQLGNFKTELSKLGPIEGQNDATAEALAGGLISGARNDSRLSDINFPTDTVPLNTFMENNVPGLADINKKISALAGGLQKAPTMAETMQAQKLGTSTAKARDEIQQMIDAFNKDPEVGKQIVPQLQEQLDQLGQRAELTKQANAPGLFGGMSFRGAVVSTGNIIGMGERAVKQAGQILYNSAPDVVKGLASKLSDNAASFGDNATVQKLSSVLNEAANRDNIGRNALIFAINQNPSYRDILNKALGESSNGQ